MAKVNVHEAKTHFSKLLRRVSAGEEIIIARGGTPVARLVPMEGMPRPRALGLYRGRIRVSGDFDETLPEEILKKFEGDDPRGIEGGDLIQGDDPRGIGGDDLIECDDPPRTRE